MERSFLLPLPKFQGIDDDPIVTSIRKIHEQSEITQWCDRLNCLTNNPALWPQFRKDFQEISEADLNCLVHFAANDDQQTILHLAVINDQIEWIAKLKSERNLLGRRNQFGLTPMELACYLHKQKSIEILADSSCAVDFLSQPNIEFENCDLLKSSHLEFLSQPIFESNDALEEIFAFTNRAKLNEEIPQDRIWMGVYYDQEIQYGIHPRMAIRLVNDEIGLGLYAAEKILPCTFIGEYTGVIQERKSRHVSESSCCVRYTAWQMGKSNFVIDAENMGNFTRFINHSDQPNASLICAYWRGAPRLLVLSLKEIPQGTQITFDYGKMFWKQFSHLVKRDL